MINADDLLPASSEFSEAFRFVKDFHSAGTTTILMVRDLRSSFNFSAMYVKILLQSSLVIWTRRPERCPCRQNDDQVLIGCGAPWRSLADSAGLLRFVSKGI